MENKKRMAYVVVTDWVTNIVESDVEFSDIFISRDEAVKFFDKAVAEERATKEDYGYDKEEMSEDGSVFCLWEDGCYCENHVRVQIKELPLQVDGRFEREMFEQYENDCRMEDLISELDNADPDGPCKEMLDMSEEKIKRLLDSHDAIDRLQNALDHNDSYWDLYWQTVRYVLETIANEEEEEKNEP